ncbi:MAG: PAS domain S-box protein, partial [Rhodospirillales bacterium]|nr:PAS domain S-box protein [Rhodospirillales bacterium]
MSLQLAAAALAFRLIRITGWRVAWVAIAAAMVLMAGKRSLGLYHFLFEDMPHPPDMTAEFFALSVSALAFAGMALLGTFLAAGRRTEDALRESQARLAQAQRLVKLAHWEWRLEQKKLEPSAELAEIMGRPMAELEVSDTEFLAFVHPDDRERLAEVYGSPDHFSESYEVRYRIVRPSGELRTVLEVGEPMYDAAGTVVGNFGALQDVTEWTKVEELSTRLGRIVENSVNEVYVFDSETLGFLEVNRGARENIGYPLEELRRLTPLDIKPEFTRETFSDLIAPLHEGLRDQVVFSTLHRRKDGSTYDVEVRLQLSRTERPPVFVAVIQDITERKLAEETLRASERRYREIFEDSPVAIWEEDWSPIKGKIDELAAQGVVDWHDYFARHPDQLAKAYDLPTTVDISREILDIYGAPSKEALSESTKAALVAPEQLECFVDMLAAFAAGKTSCDVEARDTRIDDTEMITRQRVTIPPKYRHDWSRVFIAIEDVTERKATEAQLRHAQKMEAIGQLTGGVSHDFNNLLAVVVGNLELVAEQLTQDDRCRRHVEKALGAAERGATLTQRLLAFSRKQALQPEEINAGRLVSGMTDMMRRTLGETIEIEVVSDSGLWTTSADPAQLENAVLNLAINARDAMPEGGKLTIETSNARLDDDYAAAQQDVTPGQYVLLAVTDTGTGMAPEVCARALDPFFTTKDVGSGSGLGLSMVFGFVKQSGGHVSIYSEVGEGTSVKLYLPRIKNPEQATSRPETQGDIPLARGETVLVVEDDIEVRTLVVSLLRDLGYDVREAGNGKAALDLLDERPCANLLLTDVVLPNGMSGRVLAEEVQKRLPDTAILYMSGYTENSIVHHGRLDDGVRLLQKPFRMSDLETASAA